MNTKTFFNRLALALLIPAVLLTTACSNDDDNIVNAEISYPLSITVNVTRSGNGTRAEYNEETRKLTFSSGDKLFVKGNDARATGAREFAGTLTWVSGGKFSGTIYTQQPYSGSADELFSAANQAKATLLPAGYEGLGYLSVSNPDAYKADISCVASKAFATSTTEKTARALAVEQFSYETGDYTSGSGFVLAPQNAILNFNIGGNAPTTAIDVALNPLSLKITGSVKTDEAGNAIFAVGVVKKTSLKSLSLTVGGKAVRLTKDNHTLTAGDNWWEADLNFPKAAAEASAEDLGMVIGVDGNIYASKDAAKDAGTKGVAMICYVGSDNCESEPYNHGLALSMGNANGGRPCIWQETSKNAGHAKQNNSDFSPESGLQYNATHNVDKFPAFKAAIANNDTAVPAGCSAWFLPSGYQWNQMIKACTNVLGTRNSSWDLCLAFSRVGGSNMSNVCTFWSSSEFNMVSSAWAFRFEDGLWIRIMKDEQQIYLRSCLAF